MTYRFGKHPAQNDYRTLRLKSYLTPSLQPPPDSENVLSRVYKNLNMSNSAELFPMDGNDHYSDCTIAAVAHAIAVFNGLIGVKKIIDS